MSIPIDESIKTILNVKVFIAPEKQDDFWAHFKPAFDKVIAEPQCRFFVVGKDQMDPTCLSWTEGWTEDVQWLQEVQLKKEYYVPYIAGTEPLFIKERVFQLLTPQKTMAAFKKPDSS